MLLIAWLSAKNPAVREPIIRSTAVPAVRASTFGIRAATYMFFYLGWEFHFRGFL